MRISDWSSDVCSSDLQLGYDDLVKLASWLGCEVKERIFPKIKDWLALSKIMERVETNPDWRKNNPTEGIVFQDANGFQWKSKAHGYRIWKIARSAVERIALSRRREIPRSEERRAGKVWVSTCRTGWATYH